MRMTPFLYALAALSSSFATATAQHTPQAGQVAVEPWAAAVEQGRALIAQGKGEEARLFMKEADRADANALRTRIWYIRALIEANYLNDALNFTDDLAAMGHKGPEMDYLYGMAFVYKARKYISQGVNLSMVGMQFSDSVNLLQSATEADAARFGDAYLPLAESAWNSQLLDVARAAAEKAVQLGTKNSPAHYMLGEIAFSQYVANNADEALKEQATAHWQAAYDSFQRVARLEDTASGDMGLLAGALNKSGDALVWVGRLDDAATQYALAIGTSPAAVNYSQLYGTLSPEALSTCLEAGEARFLERHDPSDPGDATLLWWIGYTEFVKGEYVAAQSAFAAAYEKWPSAGNSQWYVALCLYYQSKLGEAVDALVQLQLSDPVAVNQSIQSDLQRNLSIVDQLIGHCFQNRQLVNAGRLSAAQGNASPETSRYWNNVGLFYRDAGDQLARRAEGNHDEELRQRYYQKSYEGYDRALALEPESSVLLNDTAVILHYCLDKDLGKAREMYRASTAFATADLERTDLSDDDRALIRTALRDSKNNLNALDNRIAKRAADKAAAEAEAARLRAEKDKKVLEGGDVPANGGR